MKKSVKRIRKVGGVSVNMKLIDLFLSEMCVCGLKFRPTHRTVFCEKVIAEPN